MLRQVFRVLDCIVLATAAAQTHDVAWPFFVFDMENDSFDSVLLHFIAL